MTAPIHILATCRNPELFEATTLVFKTIRTGFPTTRVAVTGNSLSGEHAAAIAQLVESVHGSFTNADRVTHWEWIANLIDTEPAPFFICDTDVIFWSNMEGFDYSKALSGRLMPAFQCPVTRAATFERIHTALLYINPVPFRRFTNYVAEEDAARHPFDDLVIDLVKPVRFAMRGHMYFHDTLSQGYHCFSGKEFTETMLDCYDHISCGTWLDLLDRSVPNALERQMERIRNPELARGLWRQQQKYCEERPI